MTRQEPETRFSVEVRYPDGEVDKTMVSRNKWDMDITEVGDLVRQLLLGMGFAEASVDELLECDCSILVSEELPEDEDVIDMEPEVMDEYITSVWPCHMCEVCCEDTACLHDYANEDFLVSDGSSLRRGEAHRKE